MAILVEEKYRGRRSDATDAEIIYLVTGTDGDKGTISDEVAFEAVLASAPATWDGIPKANVDCREELVQDTIWLVAVQYTSTQPTIFPESSIDYEFSFQAESEKIFYSLLTIGVYSASGPVSVDYFHGLTGRDMNGPSGIDLPPGAPTNTWVFNPLHANVTDSYQSAVEEVCGAVSSVPFMGRPAGEMRLVGVQGGAKFAAGLNPKWSIRFSFQRRRNRYDFTAGGIHIPFKGGHHLLWDFSEPDLRDAESNPTDNGIAPKPKFMVVDQVFFEENLPAALGFG